MARHEEVRPWAVVPVPSGHLVVKMANAQGTSAGNAMPGDVPVLLHDEARELTRQGYAREVLAV